MEDKDDTETHTFQRDWAINEVARVGNNLNQIARQLNSQRGSIPLQEGAQQGNKLAEAMRKDLEAQHLREVGGVIITGDLTWRASEAEFGQVRCFLDDIMSWSTLTPNQIILCPGNHDIAFSDQPWDKGKVVEEVTDVSKLNFEHFYSDLFSAAPNAYLASGRRLLLARSFVVEIASLNSSHLGQAKDVIQGQGYIGERQRDFVETELNWRNYDEEGPQPFRILVMHHYLVPVIPQELAVYEQQSSVVYDAGALCNWVVKHRINLVLHGHMHHTKVVKEARSPGLTEDNMRWHEFVIASLGSTGVDLTHNQLDRRNVYGLLEAAPLIWLLWQQMSMQRANSIIPVPEWHIACP